MGNKKLHAIKFLYGLEKLDKNQILEVNGETITSWYIDGYENIAQLESKFSNSEIEILYKNSTF